MENKQQLIHVASEIVVIIGVVFYFNQKHKKMLKHIEDLSQRLEEQEDLVQKHEEIIKKLVESVNSQMYYSQPTTEQNLVNTLQPPIVDQQVPIVKKVVQKVVSPPTPKVVQKVVSPPKKLVKPVIKQEVVVEELVEEVEEDLDAELVSELEELDNEKIEEIDTTDLKKKPR